MYTGGIYIYIYIRILCINTIAEYTFIYIYIHGGYIYIYKCGECILLIALRCIHGLANIYFPGFWARTSARGFCCVVPWQKVLHRILILDSR